jgi:secondary thiamine-phosphate synthase enzyme
MLTTPPHTTSSNSSSGWFREDGDDYTHTLEGPDDMTSHIRMALTRTSEVVPVSAGNLVLGTWQGLFLFEHRRAPHIRQIAVNVTGC